MQTGELAATADVVATEPWSEHPPTLPPPVEAPLGPLPAWSAWATIGWFVLTALVTLAAQVFVGVVLGIGAAAYAAASGLGGLDAINSVIEGVYGLAVSVIGLATAGVTVGFVWLPVWLRRRGFREYLALREAGAAATFLALGAMVVLVALEVGVNIWIERPMPEEMVTWRSTAVFVPLLWLYVVLVGPIVEEVVFRGFLYRGLAESALRPVGAIVVTSLLWTVVHIQYELYELGWLFVTGLLLGVARWRTASTLVCIAGHVLLNGIAMVALEWWWLVEGSVSAARP